MKIYSRKRKAPVSFEAELGSSYPGSGKLILSGDADAYGLESLKEAMQHNITGVRIRLLGHNISETRAKLEDALCHLRRRGVSVAVVPD